MAVRLKTKFLFSSGMKIKTAMVSFQMIMLYLKNTWMKFDQIFAALLVMFFCFILSAETFVLKRMIKLKSFRPSLPFRLYLASLDKQANLLGCKQDAANMQVAQREL